MENKELSWRDLKVGVRYYKVDRGVKTPLGEYKRYDTNGRPGMPTMYDEPFIEFQDGDSTVKLYILDLTKTTKFYQAD